MDTYLCGYNNKNNNNIVVARFVFDYYICLLMRAFIFVRESVSLIYCGISYGQRNQHQY